MDENNKWKNGQMFKFDGKDSEFWIKRIVGPHSRFPELRESDGSSASVKFEFFGLINVHSGLFRWSCQIVTGGTLASSLGPVTDQDRVVTTLEQDFFVYRRNEKKNRIANRLILRSWPLRNGWYCLSIKRVHDRSNFLECINVPYGTRRVWLQQANCYYVSVIGCVLMVICVPARSR